MEERLKIQEVLSEGYEALLTLERYLNKVSLDKKIQALLKLRASQINGCAYCVHMHTQEALRLGEDPLRLQLVNTWREAPGWFTQEEKAVFSLTEELTLIADGGVCDETYQKCITLFGIENTALIILAVATTNTWNRIAKGLKRVP